MYFLFFNAYFIFCYIIAGNALDRNDPFNTEGNGTAKFIGSPGNKMKASSSSTANITTIVPTAKVIVMI